MEVEFYRHNIGHAEKEAVLQVLDSIFLSTGTWVYRFEKDLANYLGVKHAVGVNSCTAALHLSLLALGIGPGDEVITTPMTFVATSLAILHVGAKPIWVDVERETGNIDAGLVENAITYKTKAILPVHLYGQMADMVNIRKIADKYGLYVIEDAAHALEGKRDGIKVGHLGDTACFSFYATKSITSGEGGAVVTNSDGLANKIRTLRNHGIDSEAAERYTGMYRHWDLSEIGWKYNMDNIQAALLVPQMEKLEALRKKREFIYHKYRAALMNIPNVDMPGLVSDSVSGRHLFTIWVNPKRRDSILERLQEMGIGVAVNYRAIHLLTRFQTLFGRKRGSFPNAEEIGDSTISIPFYPGLKDYEIEHVVASLKRVV
jgi:dTDP-4-amino-4,6-dideoxygalactose transaminase